jgi:hypothetical protein
MGADMIAALGGEDTVDGWNGNLFRAEEQYIVFTRS